MVLRISKTIFLYRLEGTLAPDFFTIGREVLKISRSA